MQIGIIGAGMVGGALGKAWASRGHQVMFGTRHPDSAQIQKLKEPGLAVLSGSASEAVAFGDVVVLATPWNATQSAIESAGNLAGKIVLDCTNPLKADLSGLDSGAMPSGGEAVAAWAAGAHVVKIFNTTGHANMSDPRYPLQPATMFYCGDQPSAKAVAAQLATEIGFEAVDAGPLSRSRLLEPLALLWVSLAYQQKLGPNIAFVLARR